MMCAGQKTKTDTKPSRKRCVPGAGACNGNKVAQQRGGGGAGYPRSRSAAELNSTICSVAEFGAEQLLHLVQQKQAEMNLVNMSTALHRLARLETECNGETSSSSLHASDPRFQALMTAVKAKIFCHDGMAKARCLSSIAWASARLRSFDAVMMEKIGNLSLSQIHEFKPFELVILLWSFSRMELHHERLFSKASAHILDHVEDYSAACLATAIWSLAKSTSHCHENVCRKAADAFADRLEGNHSDISPVALENVMWGLATIQVHPKPKTLHAITRVVLLLLKNFKVHEFTITLWAFARLGACDERLFLSAAELVETLPSIKKNMHAQGIANLFWAYAKYAEKGDLATFNKVVTLLLPTCQKLLPELKPQELSCVLSSLSKLGKKWGDDVEIDKIFDWTAWTSRTDAFESFISDLSLKSIVAILGAYNRVMGSRCAHEPYSTLISKLLSMRPELLTEIDDATSFTIFEAASMVPHRTPQVDRVLTAAACLIANSIDGYSKNGLASLAAATAKLHGGVHDLLAGLVARRLACCNLELFTTEELTGIAKMCSLDVNSADLQCLPETLHSLALEVIQQQESAFVGDTAATVGQDPIYLNVNDPSAWRVPGNLEVTAPTCDHLDLTFAEYFGKNPIYVKVDDPASWRAPSSLQATSSGLGLTLGDSSSIPASEDPVHLNVPASLFGPHVKEPAMLTVLSEFSGTKLGQQLRQDSGDAAFDLVFELNSQMAYDVYNIKVEVWHDEYLQDAFDMSLEAGWTIPNTQTLHLQDLKDGAHEVHFTVANQRGETQGEKVVYRFWCKSGTITDEQDPVKLSEDSLCSINSLERRNWTAVARTITASTFSGSDIVGGESSEDACD